MTATAIESPGDLDFEKAAGDRVMLLPFRDVVSELTELLGPRLVSEIASVSETRAIREWADGLREARRSTQARLRLALLVTQLLTAAYDNPELPVTWFDTPQFRLGYRTAADLLKDPKEDPKTISPYLLEAAREFILENSGRTK